MADDDMQWAATAGRLLERYEGDWQTIQTQNTQLCSRAHEVRTSTRQATDRCTAAALGWHQLEEELKKLPDVVEQVRHMTDRTAASVSKIEGLEEQLTELTLACIRRDEERWRQQKLIEVAEHEAALRREVEQQRARSAEQRLQQQQAAQEERRQIFEKEFEEQRQYVLEHGEHGLRKMEALVLSVESGGGPGSLAEVQPGLVVADAELDAFYDD